MSTLVTTRSAATSPSTGVLVRLAERWRPAGLYLACLDREGNLVWHDAQMPRVMALCLTTDPAVRQQVHILAQDAALPRAQSLTPFTGIQVHLVPVTRRRKLAGFLAVLGRVETLAPGENLARAASRACLDVQALLSQGQKVPQVSPASLAALVKLVEQMHDDLQASSLQQHELSSVTEQLTSVYEELSLLYKISSGMRFTQKSETFLESVCREIQESGNFQAVGVALARPAEDAASNAGANAASVDHFAALVGRCPLGNTELLEALRGPLHTALAAAEPQVHNDLTAELYWAPVRDKIQRFVCVPMIRDRRPLGVLVAIDKLDHADFSSVDLKLLTNVGNQCSIFLENAALYQDMQDLFMGVLHALTRSIDAKDAYTRGHSQRVAELSRALARKVGLPEALCERIYLSGLLHDVGKIGVPEAVLTKPGRLTDAEFEAIKKHPTIGAQILGNIKQLQDILPGVLYHHERWDGRGYPYKLAGENIPLIGRIICVADSFDAMSSTRTYRPALPLETVLAEVLRCAGTQFDPQLAKVFVTLDFSDHRRAVQEQLPPPMTAGPLQAPADPLARCSADPSATVNKAPGAGPEVKP